MKPTDIARVITCTLFLAVSWPVGIVWARYYAASHGKTVLYIRVRGPTLLQLDVTLLLFYATMACLREIFSATGLGFSCTLSNLTTLGATTG